MKPYSKKLVNWQHKLEKIRVDQLMHEAIIRETGSLANYVYFGLPGPAFTRHYTMFGATKGFFCFECDTRKLVQMLQDAKQSAGLNFPENPPRLRVNRLPPAYSATINIQDKIIAIRLLKIECGLAQAQAEAARIYPEALPLIDLDYMCAAVGLEGDNNLAWLNGLIPTLPQKSLIITTFSCNRQGLSGQDTKQRVSQALLGTKLISEHLYHEHHQGAQWMYTCTHIKE